MQIPHKYLAVLAVAASMSMLAACSKSDDNSSASKSGAETTQPSAPETSPSPTPAPQSSPPPSNSSSSEPSLSDKAQSAADTVAQKAGELKDSAARKLDDMGHAIKQGAAEANQKIQSAAGNGSATSTPPTPSANGH